ncbi:hypothetical protein CDD82_896 [Ophiocordyceps australis]|uniref:Potassium transport protein n=1 Tax=Ophiocordyceps australis TaxID=1399860 RepID=A0A2C5YK93_9HYPO|nr:hypothetical protein CDD82_896 [Ophiocordyceps australis]
MHPVLAFLWAQLRALKPSFLSKTPTFNYLTVHYTWIIGLTVFGSIIIFGAGYGASGKISFIDALMFSSGANTQAGLNPMDVDLLSTGQQFIIYLCAMLSNPITLGASVVFLRLSFFEKEFKSLVRQAMVRRRTLTKPKASKHKDLERCINAQDIIVVRSNVGPRPRMTNDGILLDNLQDTSLPAVLPKIEASASTTTSDDDQTPDQTPDNANQGNTAITFAETVKRSDGMGEDALKLPQRRTNAQHIAIVERQRNPDDEVLRIPGPRDTERGVGPRRLQFSASQTDETNLPGARITEDAQPDQGEHATIRGRQATITITEPDWHRQTLATEDTSSNHLERSTAVAADAEAQDDADEARSHRNFRTLTMDTIRSALTRDHLHDAPYLSYTPTLGRNSNFVCLTREQREELGGIEYRSVRTLAWILGIYFFGFQLIIFTCLLAYILTNEEYGKVVENAGQSKIWWAIWTANVSFMDVGFTLTPDSMASFQKSAYILIIMWFFIIIGNTGFPVMLRFLIWVASQLAPRGSALWEELRFLLDHPRRCFTMMFPSGPTWWLFWILVLLNGVDLLLFMVLDENNIELGSLSVRERVVIGLFQAGSTRTAGFTALSLGALHPAMKILYMIMMYISVFPIAISIRRTNVYEEKSLGVYHDVDPEDDSQVSALSYVGTHLRRQLSFDLWYIFLGLFVLAITEGARIQKGDFGIFEILFEVVSAYGTVGLSLGVANVNASLCSQFSVVGKLIIIAMQIRGRHRGMPYGLDRAVLLPSKARLRKDLEEDEAIMARINSSTFKSFGKSSGIQRHGTTRSTGGRSTDRANGNLISQLLHPGPVVNHDMEVLPRRKSTDSNASAPVAKGYADPMVEHEAGETKTRPSVDMSGFRHRRSETAWTNPWRQSVVSNHD